MDYRSMFDTNALRDGLVQNTALVAQSRRRTLAHRINAWLDQVDDGARAEPPATTEEKTSLLEPSSPRNDSVTESTPMLDSSASTRHSTPTSSPPAEQPRKVRHLSLFPALDNRFIFDTAHPAKRQSALEFRAHRLSGVQPMLRTERGEEFALLPRDSDSEARLTLELARMRHKSDRMLAAAVAARNGEIL